MSKCSSRSDNTDQFIAAHQHVFDRLTMYLCRRLGVFDHRKHDIRQGWVTVALNRRSVFNPQKSSLETYLRLHVDEAIECSGLTLDAMRYPPRVRAQIQAIKRLLAVEPDLSTACIADRLSVLPQIVLLVKRGVNTGAFISLSTPLPGDDDRTLVDTLPAEEGSIEEQIEYHERLRLIERAIKLCLNDRERYVIQRLYLTSNEMTPDQLASEMQITPTRVRQLRKLAIEKLRAELVPPAANAA